MMFGAASPSSPTSGPETDLPTYVRAAGKIGFSCHSRAGRTCAAVVRQEGASRVRFPNSHGTHLEATLINIAGGVTGGDMFAVSAEIASGSLVVSTPAAEKVYRAIEAPSAIETRLVAGPGASLAWLPQETILFDRARLRRRMDVDAAADSRITVAEMVILGRTDMGEALEAGTFRDQWRVRRGGRLVFAEATRLDGAISAVMARSAVGAGARAFATVLHLSPEAEALGDAARTHLADATTTRCEAGTSAYDGLLVARFVASTGYELRRAVTDYLTFFKDLPMPRVWNS